MEEEDAKGKECDEIEQVAQLRANLTRKLTKIWAFWRAGEPEKSKNLAVNAAYFLGTLENV